MNEIREMLRNVQKPGRYIGCETNSVRKSREGRTTVALAYPDTYEIGMSYLGLRILYHLLNDMDDVACERVFAPWVDMERELRSRGRRLFSLESKTDLDRFDIVGFSLSYELTYTNVLNMLDLGGITLESSERSDEEPLVIAGGACCFNPEPLSSFIDAFIIGDAEEALPDFIETFRKLKGRGARREEILRSLASLRGVYVPSLYEARYEKGRFAGIRPIDPKAPPVIEKAVVTDLENAYYPEKQIVPLVKIVHDRTAVEVMRGCPNRCRFCQASVINRPVRIRSVERLRDICLNTYRNTGNERIALLSLSSVNYPHLASLIRELNSGFRGKGVGISIPSLRVDEAFYGIPEMISAIRKAGLTFAPETASEGMRTAIGKDIDNAVLCRSASIAFSKGWRRLKLYFMVGFPGTDARAEAEKIFDMALELSGLKKKVSGGSAEIKVSVNPFVPKPHTPFQWLGMREMSYLKEVMAAFNLKKSRKIKVEMHDLGQSLLEACLSRGGRETGRVIRSAWGKGARMDSWNDLFDIDKWNSSFAENGMDMSDCAGRVYSFDDALPWGHVLTSVESSYLMKELEASGLAGP